MFCCVSCRAVASTHGREPSQSEHVTPTALCYEMGWTDGTQVFSVSLGFQLL